MTKIRRPPYSLAAAHAKRTAAALHELARRAERGESLGAVVACWLGENSLDLQVVGLLAHRPPLALWAATRLTASIMLADEDVA